LIDYNRLPNQGQYTRGLISILQVNLIITLCRIDDLLLLTSAHAAYHYFSSCLIILGTRCNNYDHQRLLFSNFAMSCTTTCPDYDLQTGHTESPRTVRMAKPAGFRHGHVETEDRRWALGMAAKLKSLYETARRSHARDPVSKHCN
jgi:hypothetical protein